jgi:hypothetical protein
MPERRGCTSGWQPDRWSHGADVATWEAFEEWREKVRETMRTALAGIR